MKKYQDRIFHDRLSSNKKVDFNEKLLSSIEDLNLSEVVQNTSITEKQAVKWLDEEKVSFQDVLKRGNLSEDFIIKKIDTLSTEDIRLLAIHNPLSVRIIDELEKRGETEYLLYFVLQCSNFTYESVQKLIYYKGGLSQWIEAISEIELGESFIFENKDKFNQEEWAAISAYQKMSIPFIVKIINYLDIQRLKRNKNINHRDMKRKKIYETYIE